MLSEAGEVARHEIDFKVYQIAGAPVSPCRVGKSVRNEVDAEARAAGIVNGQRDAVERDRPFGGNEGSKFGGAFQDEADTVTVRLAREDGGRAVDMAGYEMAAELIPERESPFEIDAAPLPPRAERGARERFVGDLDGKARAFALCLQW